MVTQVHSVCNYTTYPICCHQPQNHCLNHTLHHGHESYKRDNDPVDRQWLQSCLWVTHHILKLLWMHTINNHCLPTDTMNHLNNTNTYEGMMCFIIFLDAVIWSCKCTSSISNRGYTQIRTSFTNIPSFSILLATALWWSRNDIQPNPVNEGSMLALYRSPISFGIQIYGCSRRSTLIVSHGINGF